MELNLIFFRGKGIKNFGDELSYVLLCELLKKYDVKCILHTNKQGLKNNVCFIGSMVQASLSSFQNVIILGSGVRMNIDKPNISNIRKVFCVRGPLSRTFLQDYKVDVPEIYGDPALLLPRYYTPKKVQHCIGKIGVVGHLSNYQKYQNLRDPFVPISPLEPWNIVVDSICSCKCILSSSLHGLIVSDAYDIPNSWLNEYALNEGSFKFEDYFMSQNRIISSINSVNDHQKADYYKDGNKIDLDKIEEQFKSMIDMLNSNNDIFYKKEKNLNKNIRSRYRKRR